MRVSHAYPTRQILLDMWIVKTYTGQPHPLESQALRWCPLEDLPSAQLLPADAPIVRALRLPERLLFADTLDYRVDDLFACLPRAEASPPDGVQLRGVRCYGPADAGGAAAAGADFVVMGEPLAEGEVRQLCDKLAIPVYIRDPSLEHAWAMGATGISDALPRSPTVGY